MKSAIQIDGIAKEYILGQREQQKTFREELISRFRAPIDRFRRLKGDVSEGERFWALKNISFDVEPGEVVGIIGHNGAGKSTLLKILSRITEPTEGRALICGRLSSLLEVGTGFHPELTGRENIYLNGAILGMGRKEIDKKLEEIIAFAEVERFIDTPVKRYSSGMQVRLAFSVAAHLEPEILLVDEVLAVGDAAFQSKCMGKMEGSASSGHTILFVSHNMASVRNLCSRGILISKGEIVFDGAIEDTIGMYLKDGASEQAMVSWSGEEAPSSDEAQLRRVFIANTEGDPAGVLTTIDPFDVVVEYEIRVETPGMRLGFCMRNEQGVVICGSTDFDALEQTERTPGIYQSRCHFPGNILASGRYSLFFAVDRPPYLAMIFSTPYCLSFDVVDMDSHGANYRRLPGVIKPPLDWSIIETGI